MFPVEGSHLEDVNTCLVGGMALYHEESPLRNTYGNA